MKVLSTTATTALFPDRLSGYGGVQYAIPPPSNHLWLHVEQYCGVQYLQY